MKRSIWIALGVSMVFALPASAADGKLIPGTEEECVPLGYSEPFSIEVLPKSAVAGSFIDKIVKASGLAKNFSVFAARVGNAAAVICGDQRVILYNPDFMNEAVRQSRNHWAPVSILAHEIGHHLNGHTLTAGGSQPAKELEADKFSGFVLERMGASRKDAIAAMKALSPEEGDETHPGKAVRLIAITKGWNEACDADDGCFRDPSARADDDEDTPDADTAEEPDSGNATLGYKASKKHD